jgi:cellulose synthase/poly-beta-1,6-N-acetylglucosamine synthase-like glycosyltransferase
MLWWTYLSLGLAYWLYNLAAVIHVLRTVPRLAAITPRDDGAWPRVSHIVPACNEAERLWAAVGSRLEEGYPNAEFVLINDRSTDDTGALMDRLAATDARVRVLHVDHLPAGWLGKVHALHRGLQLATGEWLLFSDADVHLGPGTLTRAISHCEQHALDHIGLLPDIWRGTRMLDVVMAMFLRTFSLLVRPHAVANPRSRAAIGVGAFNLVRRSALARTPGFEGLCLDVVDDVALGQMLKRHGARSGVVNGHGYVGVRWYESVRDMARGAEKAALASFARFSVVRLGVICLVLLALELSPFVVLLLAGKPILQAIAAGGTVCAFLAQLIPSVSFGRPWWPALFTPVATIVSVAILLRAGWLTVWRGGVLWRGMLYPTQMLRRGARLRFP